MTDKIRAAFEAAFQEWVITRGVWPRLTQKEIAETFFQVAWPLKVTGGDFVSACKWWFWADLYDVCPHCLRPVREVPYLPQGESK